MGNEPHKAFFNDHLCRRLHCYHSLGAGGVDINGTADNELMSMKRFNQQCIRGNRLSKV